MAALSPARNGVAGAADAALGSPPPSARQQHQQQAPGARPLFAEAVMEDDVAEVAQFVLLAKRGDAAAAADFVRRVLEEIDGSGLDMATLTTSLGADIIGVADQRVVMVPPSPDGYVPISSANKLMTPLQFFNDEIDTMVCNLVVLIPGDVHVVGHVIGKGGVEISRIEQESNTSVKIEAQVPRPLLGTGLERTVVITGSIASCVRAQRLLDRRIRIRLESDGIHREVLRIVVPNEFVRHLIGKNGTNITQLQNTTGVRIQVQAESTHPFGRAITLQGLEMGRSLAQYLISRQVAEGPYREWPYNLAQPAGAATGAPTLHAVPQGLPSTWSSGHPAMVELVANATANVGPPSPPRKSTPFTPHAAPFYPGGSALGSVPFHSTPSSWPEGITSAPHADSASAPAAASAEGNVVKQFYVPHSAVAFIIGFAGSVIEDMEIKSGARINIAKPPSSSEPESPAGRLVVIAGLPHAVQAAHRYVQMRLEAFEAQQHEKGAD